MRLRAQGFLLFSFAFSSVLTLSESLEIPLQTKHEKTTSQSSVSNSAEKRNSGNTTGTVKQLHIDHGLDKRSAEVFNEEVDKRQDLYDPDNPDNPEKRNRLGFTGMRGKKEFSPDDYCTKTLRARLEGALNKRYFGNFNQMWGGKRATLAFHGMRGKKSQEYDEEPVPESLPRQFLINSGLVDDPGEPLDFVDEKRTEEEGEDEEVPIKRSLYAFQGMRGKKENAFDLKRAMGFLGMRGKKATEVWDANYKRVPQTSFFGMKGKKAQYSGFFGMRGKKASPNAFFGIKGKRDPLAYDFQDFSLLNQVNDSGSSRNRFRRGIAWLNNSKKARNAFFGIRGKKSTEERPGSSFTESF